MKLINSKCTICLIKQILLLSLFKCMHHVWSWQLTCPDSSQWILRARGFCNSSKPSYYCLFDANLHNYKDFCRSKQDFHKPGNKYIIRGDIDGEPCERNRYQPFKFKTDGNSECTFQKSFCNEEGQIEVNNGNTTADTSCRCDYTKGYSFVIEPTQKCVCQPTLEDCSCFKKRCNKNEFLNPNYDCGRHLLGDFDCPLIQTNRWKGNITLASAPKIKPAMPPTSFLESFGLKGHNHTAQIMIGIVLISMIFVFVMFITFGISLIDECEKFIQMDEIIRKTVEERIAEKHTVSDDLTKEDNNRLGLLKIRDRQIQHINCWEKEDEQFVETTATRKIFENLKSDRCVLVVGCAGSGKSSIIRHIALKIRNEDQYEIIPNVLSPGSIFEFINRKQKQIFIIDDFCGKVITNAVAVDVWLSQINEILKLTFKSGTNDSKGFAEVKFLFATEINIYEDSIFKKLQMLLRYVFILSTLPLTEDEKLRIIEKYISPEHEILLLQTLKSDQLCFPLLCRIAKNKKADQIKKIFSSFEDFIKQDLVDLKTSNNLNFFTITLCALLNNSLKTEILDEDFPAGTEILAFENVYSKFNLGPHKDKVKKKIKEQLENLENVYVAKTDNYYHFIHTEVYQIAFAVCGNVFLHSFIKFVRSSCIAECFSFEANITDKNKQMIIIDNEIATNRYFDRLMLDLEQGETYSTFHNSQLKCESYRSKFVKYCEKRQHRVCKLFKHFNVKNDTRDITCAERDYADYIEFTKSHYFHSHTMRKPLIESTMEGYEDIVQLLLKCDYDINETDRFGRTALLVACLLGKRGIVNVLLGNNADTSLCDNKGQSPLFVASRERYDDIVNTLLHNNADVNLCDVHGDSPFLVACSGNHLSTVKILSRRMPQILQPNNLGQTPLFVASMNGRKIVLKYLLTILSEYISTPDNDGRSPLFIACKKGHQNVVKLLLERNADVSQSDWNKRSPLFITSAEGYSDIVTTLIKNKADINQFDEKSKTPLFIACDKGRTEIVRILVNNNADLSIADHKKRTPFYTACRRGFKDIVKLLHEKNASISECNKLEWSPLFAACMNGYIEIVRYLVENGGKISDSDFSGTTPLLKACENGNTKIVFFLIQSGAEINQSDQCKKTPLHAAAAEGHAAIVKILINEGALLTLTNSDRRTPLDLARKHSHKEIVELLLSSK